MKVFVSNKLEKLIQSLADQLNKPLKNPLAAETVIVQSMGMAKWISLELARRHGVVANYRFPFPKKYLEIIFSAFLPEYSHDVAFDESVLTWKIFELLPQLSDDDEFAPLYHYLGDVSDHLKMYQLAKKIASTFDQYLIFRPEMILDWEKGVIKNARETWQAKLWRKIISSQGTLHQARLRKLFLSAAKNAPCLREALPERLSIFGISYLPPYYLDIFFRLSAHIPVDYYYLNPSQEFWADISSRREIGAALGKASPRLTDMDEDLLHLESGNSLLASWGGQGRDFFRRMENSSADYIDLFEKPAGNSLLTTIQSDIYLLQEPAMLDRALSVYSPTDNSIRIHSCHSPLREIETLHDGLLDLFARDDSLTPQDILVMTPDIEQYAPYIDAVFEAREPKISYTIADRGQFCASAVSQGLMTLLDLAASRYEAGEVLSILENAAISERFAIAAADLELIRNWVSAACIKWGIDAPHRQTYDLPPSGQNTWRHGLDRLLAGCALDGRRQELYAGILPYGEIESEQTEVFGRFLTFWENAVRLKDVLLIPHTLAEWCKVLKNIIADFLPATDHYRQELSSLRDIIANIAAESQSAKSSGLIDFTVVKSYLQEVLEIPGGSSRFLAGGVSFCALLPMRSIPFAVICLMGMNNDAYPRQDRKTGFNLMEIKPLPGDRSLRHDDQYLFLEALLSAGKHLIISYVGQSATDNSEILPSVLVCEFLDYLDKNYRCDSDQPLSKALTVKHRLHAFSPAYFREDENIFSYSRQNYLAAIAILDRQEEKPPFLKDALPEINASLEVITIKDLIDFYRHPAKYFLENRLCLKLPKETGAEENNTEPFTIDPLSAYQMKQTLVESNLGAGTDQSVFELKRAEGVLPIGSAGNYYFNELARGARNYAGRILPYLKKPEREKRSIDLQIGDYRLAGALDNLYEGHRIHYRMGKLKMNDYLGTWILHLIQNAAPADGYPKTSLLLGEDHFWMLEPIPRAGDTLQSLIQYFCRGRTKPLKLFARSSWSYAEALWLNNKSREEALFAARLAWSGDDYGFAAAESQETACKICFEAETPIDEEFEETATYILKELFAHLQKLE